MLNLSRHYLGRTAFWILAPAFILLYYFLMVGFFAGTSFTFLHLFSIFWNFNIPTLLGYFLIFLTFGLVVFLGTYMTDRFNLFLIAATLLTILLFSMSAKPFITPKNLARSDWTFVFLAAPFLFVVFSYHNILPTVTTYLKRDVKKIRLAILIGTGIAFIFYFIWQWAAIGIFSAASLWETYENQDIISPFFFLEMPTTPLSDFAHLLLLFDGATALLTMGLSFVDLLGDGFRIGIKERIGNKRLYLTLLVFMPSALLAYLLPVVFNDIFGAVEGFSQIILFSIFPVMIAYIARYAISLPIPYLVPGGKITMFAVLLITFYIIYLQGIVLTP